MKSLQKLVVQVLNREYGVRVLEADFLESEAITPRYIRFPIQLAMGERFGNLKAHEREMAVLASKQYSAVFIEEGRVWVAFPRRAAAFVNARDYITSMPRLALGKAAIGLGFDGRPISVNLCSDDKPHTLITGTSGAGKTVSQRVIVTSMAYYSRPQLLGFLIFDVKGGESFDVFGGRESERRLKHLRHPVIHDVREMNRAVIWAVDEMERRQKVGSNMPRLVIVIDELADVLNYGGNTMMTHLKHILLRGRSAGIHLVCAANKPDRAHLGDLAALFKFRITLSQVRATDAYVATNVAGTGAHRLGMYGDMMIGDRQIRCQGFWISSSDILALLAKSYVDKDQFREIDFYGGIKLAAMSSEIPPEPTPGRPEVPATDEEIGKVTAYREKHGRWPTVSAISKGLFGETMGTARAGRILASTRERWEHERDS